MSEQIDKSFPEVKKSINEKSNKAASKILTNNYPPKFHILFNFLIYSFIFILLPKNILLSNESYIEITFNSNEDIQKISNILESDLSLGSTTENDKILDLINKAQSRQFNNNNTLKLIFSEPLTDFSYMFNNSENIISVHMHYIIGNNSTMSYMFNNCINLELFSYEGQYDQMFEFFDLSGMFYNCVSLTSVSFQEFSFVKNEYYDIKENEFTQLPSNALNISEQIILIKYTEKIERTPNLINDINISYIFYNCNKLNSINLDFILNQNVNDMRYMFYNCISLTSINLERFKTRDSSFINISYMFFNCIKLTSIQFNPSEKSLNIYDMKELLYNCNSLKDIDLTSFKPNESFFDFSNLFYNCYNLTLINWDLKDYKISNVNKMFYNCSSLITFDFNSKEIIEKINMTKMFYNSINIRNITFSYSSSVKIIPNDISYMFYNCQNLDVLKLNDFNTHKVLYINFLFYNCRKLEYLYLDNSNFSNTLITGMRGVFQNCESLISLDLTNFYTSNVEIMWDMFKGCKSLHTLIIPNFDTSKVTDMQSMFEGCSSLQTLNLNHFNTTNVQYMNQMFKDCTNLEVLYFKNINSESLGTMYRMFYNCKSLTYLNIYSLIEDVQSITEIFEGSSNNFTLCVKEDDNIPNIFEIIYNKNYTKRDCSESCYGEGNERIYAEKEKKCCRNVEYDGKCYDECPGRTMLHQNITNKCEDFYCEYFYNYEQDNCSETDIIPEGYYINDTDLKTIDKCDDNCKTCINNSSYCTSCKDDQPYLYLHKCYNSCLIGDYIDTDGIKKCKCELEKCLKCSEESLNKKLCETCNKGYYKKSDEIFANNFINCYEAPQENYYLDQNQFNPCYSSCKYCYKSGNNINHFCSICNLKNNYPIPMEDSINNITYVNCFPNCSYNYYFDNMNNYKCINTKGCPSFVPLLIENTKQCVASCKETKNIYEFRNTCFKSCPPESKNFSNSSGYYCNSSCPIVRPFEKVEKQICVSTCTIMERYYKLCVTNYEGNETDVIQDMILSDIQYDIIGSFKYSFITKDQNIIIEEKNVIYEITSTITTYHDPKTTIINLGECEHALKRYYGINENATLYILKVDATVDGKVGAKVEYEVYCPIGGTYLQQLDLTICEGIDIYIGFPLNITNNDLDLYNRDSPYYNDICYPYTNENGTDITLEDRQTEFEENDRSLCEEDCTFGGIDEKTGTAKCSCQVKISLSMISEIKIDKKKLYKFMNIKQIANFNIMKCYKLLFSAKGIKINIGFYTFIPTIIIYIISIIMFYFKEFRKVQIQINEIVFAKKLLDIIQRKKNDEDTLFKTFLKKKKIQLNSYNNYDKNLIQINKRKTQKEKNIPHSLNENDDENIKDINLKKNIFTSVNKKEKKIIEVNKTSNSNPPKKILDKKIKIEFKNKENIEPSQGSKEHFFMMKNLIEKNSRKESYLEKQKQKLQETLKANDTEINDFGYKKAIKYDDRTYFKYYFSLIKTKHMLLQIFVDNDYNSRWIKILLLFFNFSSCYAINALFFNDETMHQIYEDGGDFNFIYQLPQIAYSTAISMLIDFIMNSLALSQDAVLEIKSDKVLRHLALRAQIAKEKIRIKSKIFFILNFFFILLFWYYLGCFCAVYKNTQFHLIKDTLISYGTGFLTPLGIYLIPGIFRIPSLSRYSQGRRILYNFSKLIQNLF